MLTTGGPKFLGIRENGKMFYSPILSTGINDPVLTGLIYLSHVCARNLLTNQLNSHVSNFNQRPNECLNVAYLNVS